MFEILWVIWLIEYMCSQICRLNMKKSHDDIPTSSKIKFENSDEEVEEDEEEYEESASEDVSV